MRKFQVPNAVSKPATAYQNKKLPQQPDSATNQSSTESQFVCMYNKKGPKKKKTFIDGLLVATGEKLILKDSISNLQVASVRPTTKVLSSINVGAQLDIGPYEVEVLEIKSSSNLESMLSCGGDTFPESSVLQRRLPTNNPPLAPPLQKRPVFKSLLLNRTNDQQNHSSVKPLKRSISPPPPLLKPDNTEHASAIEAVKEPTGGGQRSMKRPRLPPEDIKDPLSMEITSDPGLKSLLRVLQPHQKEAVRFMWSSAISSSLRTKAVVACDSECGGASPVESGGCILADSMGLGKTLSTIAFIYACVQHRLTSKVVVVVPSSLVENWRNEFSKWLRHFLSPHVSSADRKVLIGSSTDNKAKITKPKNSKKKKPADDSDDDVSFPNQKQLGGVETAVVEFTKFKAPVLIISYEGFRKHSDMLNNSANVDMIICDEGHRLKCAQGSKTFTSLQESPAFFKLLLTGTPVQNNLLELHAMVNFVRPGVLGTLGEFRKEFSDSIAAGRDLLCSEDEKGYGKAKANELRSVLQSVILRRTAEVLVNSLPARKELVVFCRLSSHQQEVYQSILNDSGFAVTRSHTQSQSPDDNHVGMEDNLVDSDAEDAICEDGDLLPLVAIESMPHKDRDALASIHALRMVCNHPILLQRVDKEGAKTSNLSTIDVSMSSKLQLLEGLLSEVINGSGVSEGQTAYTISAACRKPSSCDIERIVIVSNFTSTLNVISSMAAMNGWKCLRIDGSTPTDQRQSLVDRFNRRSPTDEAYIFLLSSHAGGVGLNLVGASRLVLFDSDWNPAIDQQTMGRIWRQGQKRPVFIYRLLCTGTLEEKMYQRQIAKGELSCAVEVPVHNDQTDRGEEEVDVRHFEQEDIRDLFYFRPDVMQCDTFECMRGKWSLDDTEKALGCDCILKKAIQNLKSSENYMAKAQVSFVHLHE